MADAVDEVGAPPPATFPVESPAQQAPASAPAPSHDPEPSSTGPPAGAAAEAPPAKRKRTVVSSFELFRNSSINVRRGAGGVAGAAGGGDAAPAAVASGRDSAAIAAAVAAAAAAGTGGYKRLRSTVTRTQVDAASHVHTLVAAADARKKQAASLHWEHTNHLSLGVRVAFRPPNTSRSTVVHFGTVVMYAAESCMDALDDLYAVRTDSGADVLLGTIEMSEALELYSKVDELDLRRPPKNGDEGHGTGDNDDDVDDDPALEAYLRSEHNNDVLSRKSSSSSSSSSSGSSSSGSAGAGADEEADEGATEEDIPWTVDHPAVGKAVAAYFNGGKTGRKKLLYTGKVAKYAPPSTESADDALWHIVWADGDSEDYNGDELDAGLKLWEKLQKEAEGDAPKRAGGKGGRLRAEKAEGGPGPGSGPGPEPGDPGPGPGPEVEAEAEQPPGDDEGAGDRSDVDTEVGTSGAGDGTAGDVGSSAVGENVDMGTVDEGGTQVEDDDTMGHDDDDMEGEDGGEPEHDPHHHQPPQPDGDEEDGDGDVAGGGGSGLVHRMHKGKEITVEESDESGDEN